LLSLIHPPARKHHQPEQMQRIRVLAARLEHLPINRLRGIQLPRLVMRNPPLQRLLNIEAHRSQIIPT
jgi:hypothetical protein